VGWERGFFVGWTTGCLATLDVVFWVFLVVVLTSLVRFFTAAFATGEAFLLVFLVVSLSSVPRPALSVANLVSLYVLIFFALRGKRSRAIAETGVALAWIQAVEWM
jgi:hypothetical protein